MSQSSLAKGKENLTKTAIKQRPSWRLQIALAFGIVGAIAYTCKSSLAQITPDATLGAEGSIVTPNANVGGFPADLIQGGATRGANLFHSFDQFNVGNGQLVYFANPAGIENILTRVTGNTVSNILGTLGVDGGADLFLLNPNGIIFGPNARLDVGGSFFATTANAVQFGDRGFFSATNPETPGLLTVKPSAFFFNQLNAGTIVNQSVARNPIVPSFREGLRVPNGENLVLLGGNVNIDGGHLNVFGGRVEIGAVAGTGTVGLNVDGNLNFPTDIQRADVSFTNGAEVDVSLDNGGHIAITARNIDISGGSLLLAGIASRFGSVSSQAGDITLNATDTIRLESGSAIRNDVRSNGTGKGGNLNIKTGSLFVVDDSFLTARTSGIGDAGSVIINARDRIVFNGDDTTVDSSVRQTGRGKGGDIRIFTNTLELLNGAQLISATLGFGDAGDVVIEARDRISFIGYNTTTSTSSNTGAFSSVGARIGGNPIRNAQGKGGDIRISTNILELSNGAQMASGTFGVGDAGNIVIEVRDHASFRGDDTMVVSRVERTGRGKGGDIRISTNTLEVSNDAALNASTLGMGDAGDVVIESRDHASFNNGNAFSSVWGGVQGKGGDIRISTNTLEVSNGSWLASATFGSGKAGNIRILTNTLDVSNRAELTSTTFDAGDAGNVIIEARDRVTFDYSLASSNVDLEATGNGGNIEITTGILEVRNEAELVADTSGQGNAGSVIINATDLVMFDSGDVFSSVQPGAIGNGGNVEITTGSLLVTNGAQLQADTDGRGNAGSVIINARERVTFDGTSRDGRFSSAAFTSVDEEAVGSGGNVEITAEQVRISNGAALAVETRGLGRAGNIEITTSTLEVIDGAQLQASTFGQGNAGNIQIDARDNVRIANGAVVQAQTFSDFRGGDVIINARNLSLSDRAQIASSSQGTGDAGRVEITATEAVRLTNSDITTSAPQASGGAIAITTEFLSLNRGKITAATGTTGAQGAANITLQGLDLLFMGNESLIEANALNEANGGNVAIDSTFIVAMPPTGPEGSDITANAVEGKGGRVSINTQGLFGIEFRPELTPDNDITVSSTFGLSGEYVLNSPGIDPSRGLAQLPTNLIDASQQIDRRCTPGGEARNSSFTITGRGGLPPSPNDVLQGETVVTSWVSLNAEVENHTPPVPATPTSSAPRKLVEAQGWVINEKGEVVLTASAPTLTPTESGLRGIECPASPPENASQL